MPNGLVLEGEGPWGLSGVQHGIAEAMGENVLLSFNFLHNGHANNHMQLMLSLTPSQRLADSLHRAIEQIRGEQQAANKK
jgi:hypothetical protein